MGSEGGATGGERKASEVHVSMNNCYIDYAQVNARQLADLLPAVDP